MLLDVREIICGYENTIIVDGCNVSVKKGDIACIVGPNGAGKSTAMKAIFGLIPIKSGKVIFNNEDITSLNPQERVIKGMSFVPQNNNIFQEMSIEENLENLETEENGLKPLKYIPDWRWCLEGEKTFWYPSMKLFRQKERDNWKEVMERVSSELEKEIEAKV